MWVCTAHIHTHTPRACTPPHTSPHTPDTRYIHIHPTHCICILTTYAHTHITHTHLHTTYIPQHKHICTHIPRTYYIYIHTPHTHLNIHPSPTPHIQTPHKHTPCTHTSHCHTHHFHTQGQLCRPTDLHFRGCHVSCPM